MVQNTDHPKLIDGIKCYTPDEAEDYADYPEHGFEVTERLEEKSFWVQSRTRLLMRMVQRYASEFANPSFLEVGCGTGLFLRKLSTGSTIKITGSEIYLRGLLFAKRKAPAIEFIQYDVAQGPLPQSFDMVGAFDVIEHIEEDFTALSNIFLMTNPGGFLFVTVPQYKFLWSRLDEIVLHKRRYSKSELMSKLEGAGFRVRFVSSFVSTLFPLMLIARLSDKTTRVDTPAEREFEDRVRFPAWLNWAFDKIMRIDEVLISFGIPLPFGGSLFAVAKRPAID